MENQESVWDKEYRENKGKWHKETLDVPEKLRGRRVLELGAGNGKTLKSILKQEPKRVIAVDISSEAVAQLKDSFQDKRLQIVKADATKLPFHDGEFEVVVCYYVLNNLLERGRERVVDEIYRVLRPKGIVLFEDFATEDFREIEKENKIIEDHTIENKNGIICHFFTVKELTKLFKRFHDIKLNKKVFFPIAHINLRRKLVTGIIKKAISAKR